MEALIVICTLLGGGFGGWLIAAYKARAEVKTIEADANTKVAETAERLVNAQGDVIDDLREHNASLTSQVAELTRRVVELEAASVDVPALRKEITGLREELSRVVAERDGIARDYLAAKETIAKLEGEIDALNAKVLHLETDLARLGSRASDRSPELPD